MEADTDKPLKEELKDQITHVHSLDKSMATVVTTVLTLLTLGNALILAFFENNIGDELLAAVLAVQFIICLETNLILSQLQVLRSKHAAYRVALLHRLEPTGQVNAWLSGEDMHTCITGLVRAAKNAAADVMRAVSTQGDASTDEAWVAATCANQAAQLASTAQGGASSVHVTVSSCSVAASFAEQALKCLDDDPSTSQSALASAQARFSILQERFSRLHGTKQTIRAQIFHDQAVAHKLLLAVIGFGIRAEWRKPVGIPWQALFAAIAFALAGGIIATRSSSSTYSIAILVFGVVTFVLQFLQFATWGAFKCCNCTTCRC